MGPLRLSMLDSLTIETHSPEQTQQVGRIIGEQAQPGDIYLLVGPLGAGKTCLTQGIAWGLGVTGHTRSPTFVLMTRYQGRLTLHHMDLYRIGDPLEAWDLGLDEYLSGDGVCVIEWADQAEEVFPEDALWINFDYGTNRQSHNEPGKSPPPPFRKGELEEISGAPSDEHPEADTRIITFGKHSARYDPLLQKLGGALPETPVTP